MVAGDSAFSAHAVRDRYLMTFREGDECRGGTGQVNSTTHEQDGPLGAGNHFRSARHFVIARAHAARGMRVVVESM